jgi:hypothetical protein
MNDDARKLFPADDIDNALDIWSDSANAPRIDKHTVQQIQSMLPEDHPAKKFVLDEMTPQQLVQFATTKPPEKSSYFNTVFDPKAFIDFESPLPPVTVSLSGGQWLLTGVDPRGPSRQPTRLEALTFSYNYVRKAGYANWAAIGERKAVWLSESTDGKKTVAQGIQELRASGNDDGLLEYLEKIQAKLTEQSPS